MKLVSTEYKNSDSQIELDLGLELVLLPNLNNSQKDYSYICSKYGNYCRGKNQPGKRDSEVDSVVNYY